MGSELASTIVYRTLTISEADPGERAVWYKKASAGLAQRAGISLSKPRMSMANNKHKASQTSQLSKTLAPHFNALPPDEFSARSCGAKSSCTLAAGIEHLFVYLAAHAFLERTKKGPP